MHGVRAKNAQQQCCSHSKSPRTFRGLGGEAITASWQLNTVNKWESMRRSEFAVKTRTYFSGIVRKPSATIAVGPAISYIAGE